MSNLIEDALASKLAAWLEDSDTVISYEAVVSAV